MIAFYTFNKVSDGSVVEQYISKSMGDFTDSLYILFNHEIERVIVDEFTLESKIDWFENEYDIAPYVGLIIHDGTKYTLSSKQAFVKAIDMRVSRNQLMQLIHTNIDSATGNPEMVLDISTW
jgi:hypothetical protein